MSEKDNEGDLRVPTTECSESTTPSEQSGQKIRTEGSSTPPPCRVLRPDEVRQAEVDLRYELAKYRE